MIDRPKSKKIQSNQIKISSKLKTIVSKNIDVNFEHPMQKGTIYLCQKLRRLQIETGVRLFIDSGCGTGDGTIAIGKKHPTSIVIGIDRNIDRLAKAHRKNYCPNVFFVRANLIEFWLALKSEDIKVDTNYLLYPNPWPKHRHIRRRWHAHPIMGVLMNLSERLEIRTNWKIYAMEFCRSIEISCGTPTKFERFQSKIPLTSFEKKYINSGHDLFQIIYRPKANENRQHPLVSTTEISSLAFSR